MNLFKLTEKAIKKMKWYDMSLLKLALFFWAFFLITVWPALGNLVLGVEWYWHLVIAIVLSIPLWKKMFD